MDRHGVGEMTVRLVVRETFCKGQSPVFIQVQIGQLSTDRFPVGSLVCQPQFGSQLGSGIESKVHQGKVIVCHILEPRIDRVVENFRAGTQRNRRTPSASTVEICSR